MPIERVIGVDGKRRGFAWHCYGCGDCSPTYPTKRYALAMFDEHAGEVCQIDYEEDDE